MELFSRKMFPLVFIDMRKFVICCVLVFLPCVCFASLYETWDKVTSQTWSFISFATRMEENLHECMHREVKYYYYHRNGRQSKEVEIYKNDIAGMKEAGFDFKLPTVMVIHGYTDNRKRSIIVRLRNALLNNLNANIIIVDWHNAAGQIYFTAVTNTYPVGEQVGEFLQHLEDAGYNLNNMHLIGHSLGSQISGVAGEKVGGRLGRITGLDPAGPLFEFFDKRNTSMSLDKTDAQFVDIIHSAMGSFGVVKPIGHADFYPNDGLAPQPGCNNIIMAVSCSHIRSVEFFAESLNASLPQYLSKTCTKWKEYHLLGCLKQNLVPMGYYTPKSARGLFYVQTNEEEPFGMNGKFYKRVFLYGDHTFL